MFWGSQQDMFPGLCMINGQNASFTICVGIAMVAKDENSVFSNPLGYTLVLLAIFFTSYFSLHHEKVFLVEKHAVCFELLVSSLKLLTQNKLNKLLSLTLLLTLTSSFFTCKGDAHQ